MTSARFLIPIGTVLVLIGLVGLLYGGITYIKNRDTQTLGPLEFTVVEKEHIAMHPAVGAVVLMAGGSILFISIRRK